ncbi:MAG: glycosyltransferase [Desulfovibrionales bacterium]|nr:glycosyltransferase [Desulfovibrionales bacterium]
MNICMFTNTYLPHTGGVAKSVSSFAQDLRLRGHQVLIVSPTFPHEDEVSDEDNVLRIPAIQNFNGSDFSLSIPVPFYIRNKINKFQPDIIHSHHPYLLGDVALRTAYRKNLPLVFTHHTLYEQYTHYVPLDSKVMKRLAILMAISYANHCTRVVAPSQSIARLIANRGVKTPVGVIPTGVDVDYFRSGNGADFRQSHNIPEHIPVIGHLGRLAPEKNLEYLTRAVVQALKMIEHEACFLVVGSGPSQKRIQQIFQEKGMQDRLIMAGKQTGRKLADAYRAMNVFAFASKSETQGMVLTESMAAGVPVIALDAPGVREVVKDHYNGRLLNENTVTEDFAGAIAQFLDKENDKLPYEKGAQETAMDFSRENSVQKLIDTYKFLLKEKDTHRISEKNMSDARDNLLLSLKTEWSMLSEKANLLMHAVQDREK